MTWFCHCTTKNFTVLASLAFIVQLCNCIRALALLQRVLHSYGLQCMSGSIGYTSATIHHVWHWHYEPVAVLEFTLGGSGVAIIAAGGTDLYCHSKPPLTSGKLCFIINFIGAKGSGQNFYWGRGPRRPSPWPPLWTAPVTSSYVSV